MAVTSRKRRTRPKKRTGRKAKAKRTVKRRSAAAASLADARYRNRVVRSAKVYSRKRRARAKGEGSVES